MPFTKTILLGLCLAAMFFMRARHLEPTERAMQWPDALGLGLFLLWRGRQPRHLPHVKDQVAGEAGLKFPQSPRNLVIWLTMKPRRGSA